MFFRADYSHLPTSIGVFPLDDVILLPRMQLTLNVFEPRYLNLVEDALQNRRMLAIVQPRAGDENDLNPPLFSVAGLGRIVAFQEEGNRLLMSLEGVARVRLQAEQRTDRGYRIFAADYGDFADDFETHRSDFLNRDKMMPLLERYLEFMGIKLSVESLSHISDRRLVYSVAMLANFDRAEKQALLECLDAEKQAEILMTLMLMALEEQAGDGYDII